MTDVVAEPHALDDPPGEPARAVGQQRDPLGARRPVAAGELVDVVAGLAAEQLDDASGLLRNEVNDKRIAATLLEQARRPVLVRHADQEARRVDAALRREADEAAVALAADE